MENEENETLRKTVHFSVTGEYLTDKVRDCVASDMLGAHYIANVW